MVTSGAAAAMSTAVAAVIAGTDPDKIWQLPDTTGLKNEVVMLGGRNAFDSALRLAGGKLVLAPTLADLAGAIGPKTCLVYTTFRDERVQDALKVTKAAGVPLLVDASSSVPPFENFTKFAKWGVDLYAISGGKGLGGPQCSGLLLGRKDLIEAGMANSAPWEGAVCRAMKVGKEEIMGILAAVEYWSKADLNALNKEWQGRVERVAKLAETVPGVTTTIEIPVGSNSYPTLTVNWDEAAFGLTVAQCVEELAAGTPRIEALSTLGNRSLIAAAAQAQARRRQQAAGRLHDLAAGRRADRGPPHPRSPEQGAQGPGVVREDQLNQRFDARSAFCPSHAQISTCAFASLALRSPRIFFQQGDFKMTAAKKLAFLGRHGALRFRRARQRTDGVTRLPHPIPPPCIAAAVTVPAGLHHLLHLRHARPERSRTAQWGDTSQQTADSLGKLEATLKSWA